MARPSLKAYGFDFIEAVRKEFSKNGTGSYRVVIETPDGTRYDVGTFPDVKTDTAGQLTVIKVGKPIETDVNA